jgi:hypothetical protein
MDSSDITALEGRGRSYLGDHAAAAALYRRSLDDATSRSNAVYRAGLAAALAGSGDVTGAVAGDLPRRFLDATTAVLAAAPRLWCRTRRERGAPTISVVASVIHPECH